MIMSTVTISTFIYATISEVTMNSTFLLGAIIIAVAVFTYLHYKMGFLATGSVMARGSGHFSRNLWTSLPAQATADPGGKTQLVH